MFVALQVHLFLAKRKRVLSVSVVFTCSCNVEGTLWITTLHIFHNQERISELLFNSQEILSVETILARTMDVSNIILKVLISYWKCKLLDQSTRKRNLFDVQNKNSALGTQTRTADFDNRFCREVEKSFCAGKVNMNTLYSHKTRPQWD